MKCPNCGSLDVQKIDDTRIRCSFCLKESSPQVSPSNVNKEPLNPPLDFERLLSSVVSLKTPNGNGTGFIIHPKGFVLTNAHVIKDAPIVEGNKGQHPKLLELEAYSDGSIVNLDLAILKIIEEAPYAPLKWAKEPPRMGDEVYVLGNPKNLGLSVNKGSISKITQNEIQLNVTLNPGNSGGPVVNQAGEVIGVISYLLEDVQGMAFAIHLTSIKEFIQTSFKSIGGNDV